MGMKKIKALQLIRISVSDNAGVKKVISNVTMVAQRIKRFGSGKIQLVIEEELTLKQRELLIELADKESLTENENAEVFAEIVKRLTARTAEDIVESKIAKDPTLLINPSKEDTDTKPVIPKVEATKKEEKAVKTEPKAGKKDKKAPKADKKVEEELPNIDDILNAE